MLFWPCDALLLYFHAALCICLPLIVFPSLSLSPSLAYFSFDLQGGMAQNSSEEKDAWLVGLHQFLNTRLRTVPYAAATRVRPNVSVPLPLQNTQYMIDGLMWSVRDCVAWAADAWLCAQSHLHSCTQRFTQLSEQLNREELQQSRREPNTVDEAAVDGEAMERERLYDCHACVQDVYVAFCVVDAFLRHMSDASISVKELAEKELPRLVADHIPLWQRPPSRYMQQAMEEYSLLFLDMLRSWTTTRVLRPDTQRRIEEYVRHKLKTVRDAPARPNGVVSDSSGVNSIGTAGGLGGGRLRAVSAGLRMLLSNATAHPQKSTEASPVVAADAARLTIASFISAIFPSSRSEAGRNRCAHCGLVLKNATAKSTHYRYHFCSRSYNTDLKIMRLPYPSLDDYMFHEPDCGETGNFVRVTYDMLDVFRAPENRTVRVRRAKKAPESK
uniref:Uncharacterized protein TCIL3000_4_3460 n=1 Tax=Trypanosoma congolense (strain IL3000) TaxID=1068625 RepID=G0ULI9_TRYCI|nr:unnamed protein product [Trypanosoma congolense IL3000]